MASLHQNKIIKNSSKTCNEPTCTKPSCFFCAMDEPDPILRESKITKCFKQIPLKHDQQHVLTLTALWNIAMTRPNSSELPFLGIFKCMAKLINKSLTNKKWLLKHQNIYIPYYAAHIIGSYTMNKPQFAEIAIESGVVSPLKELLRGKISWVEQRVAARALGHLASHGTTFESIAAIHEAEIVELSIKLASTCVDEVYEKFVSITDSKRLKYHCDLLTRGLGGLERENRKAEQWAIQIQRYSLYIINCFARKERSLNLICKKKFLKSLCEMWGGLANPSSPSGIGLIRTLCNTKTGRKSIAEIQKVIETLCNVSRTSDYEGKNMAIESLSLLLKDPETRFKIFDITVLFLVDLVELETIGDVITQTLLQDYHKIKYGYLRLNSERAGRALEEIWDLKVERRKREKLMSEQEVRERKLMVGIIREQGNEKFRAGEIEDAVMKYSKGLDFCLSEMRRERIVLYSNRAQCFLLLKNAEAAISDTTRALCLCSEVRPHGKSLWRRSQAYDMKGLGKESLMDCLLFVSRRQKSVNSNKRAKIPYYAARMINKQINSTWIFAAAKSRTSKEYDDNEFNGHKDTVDRTVMTIKTKTEKKKKKKEEELCDQ